MLLTHATVSLTRFLLFVECLQEITAEDIARLTARPATQGDADAAASDDSSAGSDAEGSGAGGSGGEAAGPLPAAERAAAATGQAPADAASESSEDEAAAVPQAAAAGHGDADADAAEVAALLREENLEALAEEERDKLTQVGGWWWVGRRMCVSVCAGAHMRR